jgi:hypothetical protein
MHLPPGRLERALEVDGGVSLRPAGDDAVSEDLADRLAQPLRDFERAALFNLAQGCEQFGWLNLGDGAGAISGYTSASSRVTTWSW